MRCQSVYGVYWKMCWATCFEHVPRPKAPTARVQTGLKMFLRQCTFRKYRSTKFPLGGEQTCFCLTDYIACSILFRFYRCAAWNDACIGLFSYSVTNVESANIWHKIKGNRGQDYTKYTLSSLIPCRGDSYC